MDGVQTLIFKTGRRPDTSWVNAGKFLRKISVSGATGCQILKLKCKKIDFRSGSAPDPAGGAYNAPPALLAGLQETYF